MLNAQKVLALNVDALLISFICMLMLLILSLHQERTDRDKIKRFSFFWKWNLIIGNINADDVKYGLLSLSHEQNAGESHYEKVMYYF